MVNNSRKGVQRILARILLGMIFVPTFAVVVLAVPCNSTTVVETVDQCQSVVEKVETIPEETVVLNDIAITYPELVYEDLGYKHGAVDYCDAIQFYIEDIKMALVSDTFTENAAVVMQNELNRLTDIAKLYQADVERFVVYESEHYYAAQVWQRLRLSGFSEAAAAGVLGNMMWETAGGTLDLKPNEYSSGCGYYGICQWSVHYNPRIKDTTFEEQLEYLLSNIDSAFKSFGFCYRSGFTYKDFKSMGDPTQAALAFVKVYERCSSGSYGLRKSAAKEALEYFTS